MTIEYVYIGTKTLEENQFTLVGVTTTKPTELFSLYKDTDDGFTYELIADTIICDSSNATDIQSYIKFIFRAYGHRHDEYIIPPKKAIRLLNRYMFNDKSDNATKFMLNGTIRIAINAIWLVIWILAIIIIGSIWSVIIGAFWGIIFAIIIVIMLKR